LTWQGWWCPGKLQRSLRHDEEEAERSARALLAVMARQLGRNDLDCVHVLDIGCGVKITQALVNDGLPIGSYTGVDVSASVIDFLRSSVDDPRFACHHVDFHNALYNPTGVKMGPDAVLPVERADFDLICGFSLVTHLAPDDTKSILEISARYAHDRTRWCSPPSSTSTPRRPRTGRPVLAGVGRRRQLGAAIPGLRRRRRITGGAL
jgi:SAM-dependent methyltransferase